MGVFCLIGMSGFDLNVLNLNGDYVVDPRSESLEEVMRLQGIGWATRKLGAKFANSMGLTLQQTETELTQTYSASVKTKIVKVDLTSDGTKEILDPDMNVKVKVTVTWEEDGQLLKIKTVGPKFERVVTWNRESETCLHSIIDFSLTDGSNERVKVNRYYVKAPNA